MRLIGLFVLIGALVGVTAAAEAGSVEQGVASQKLSITSAQDGPFTTSGHVLCPSGQASTPFAAVSRTFPDGSLDLVVVKAFACDDGTGTFEMVIHVRLKMVAGQFTNNFRWLVTGGTGAYAELEGFGTGVGETRNGEAVDLYDGRIANKG